MVKYQADYVLKCVEKLNERRPARGDALTVPLAQAQLESVLQESLPLGQRDIMWGALHVLENVMPSDVAFIEEQLLGSDDKFIAETVKMLQQLKERPEASDARIIIEEIIRQLEELIVEHNDQQGILAEALKRQEAVIKECTAKRDEYVAAEKELRGNLAHLRKKVVQLSEAVAAAEKLKRQSDILEETAQSA